MRPKVVLHETTAAWIKTGRRQQKTLLPPGRGSCHSSLPADPPNPEGDAKERKPAGADAWVPIRKAGQRLAPLARARPPLVLFVTFRAQPATAQGPAHKALGPMSCSVVSAP